MGRMRNLNEIGELGISVHNQSMNLKNNKCWHRNYYRCYLKKERERRDCYLVLNLVFLGFLERNVIFGETSLALPVLKQYESDLQHPISSTQTKRRESFTNNLNLLIYIWVEHKAEIEKGIVRIKFYHFQDMIWSKQNQRSQDGWKLQWLGRSAHREWRRSCPSVW